MTAPDADPPVLGALRSHPFLAGLADGDLVVLARCGRLQAVAAGQVLAREGRAADTFHLVVDGQVALQVHSPRGGAIVLSTVGAGQVLGWSWRFPPHRWFFDAVTVVDTTTVLFEAAALRAALEERPALDADVTCRLGVVVTDRLRDARTQLLDLYEVSP